ncbi:Hypothetical predicted protein [Marmota monax]|uniref:Uncharacterized protein n=1 Tax=Marmota monax TaxID=9995 RepID=A0A5E4AXI2_MARMO|nr:Hypothetical predicted protein [Marmota monax]
MQWVADGHKPIIGHHNQKHMIHITKKEKKRHLCQAAHIGDGSAVSLGVHEHLGDHGGDEADVSQGQVGEEEVHGGVEVGVRADSQHDEQVPKHCDQVHGQEQSKEEGLQVWIF